MMKSIEYPEVFKISTDTQDEIKKILKKYNFIPEFKPNIRDLLTKDNSIHQLKILKKKSTLHNL